jgi:catechol-2,3-dioxygenase
MISANLSHVSLSVEDLPASRTFYENVMGLAVHDIADDRMRMGWGIGQHALELVEGEPGLDHFAYEVPDPAHLQQLEQSLTKTGVETRWIQPEGAHPRVLECRDPEGNRIEFHSAVERSGERIAGVGRRPVRVQHVTLATESMSEMVEFYERTIGLRVSDRMGDMFVWMRSNREHHTLALVESPVAGIDHYSYDVAGWEDFKAWCDALAAHDVRVAWGPGRHGPGNNLFIIFEDAAGVRVELSAEMELYWDDRAEYAPRVWQPAPETVNLWGPVPSWRQATTKQLTA